MEKIAFVECKLVGVIRLGLVVVQRLDDLDCVNSEGWKLGLRERMRLTFFGGIIEIADLGVMDKC